MSAARNEHIINLIAETYANCRELSQYKVACVIFEQLLTHGYIKEEEE